MDPYESILPSRIRADGAVLVKSGLVGLVGGLIAANTEPGIGALAMVGLPLLNQFHDEGPGVPVAEQAKMYGAFFAATTVAYAVTFGANYFPAIQSTITALR